MACTTSTLVLRRRLEARSTSHRAVTPSSPRSTVLVAEPGRAAPPPLPFPRARARFLDPYAAPRGKFQCCWWLIPTRLRYAAVVAARALLSDRHEPSHPTPSSSRDPAEAPERADPSAGPAPRHTTAVSSRHIPASQTVVDIRQVGASRTMSAADGRKTAHPVSRTGRTGPPARSAHAVFMLECVGRAPDAVGRSRGAEASGRRSQPVVLSWRSQ